MSATVIVYHGLGDAGRGTDPYRMLMPVAHFEWQMQFLARHRRVVSLEQLLAGTFPHDRPAVAITFDDGYASVLEVGAPILAVLEFPAVAFVPTFWVGRCKGWDPLDADARPMPVMTPPELTTWTDLGHEVASHGHRHVRLGPMSYAAARAEIAASMSSLTAITGVAPRYLAYPWGSHSEASRLAARDAGLSAAFSIGQPGCGDFARERVTIRPTDGRALFAYKTSGRYLASRQVQPIAGVYRLTHPLVRELRGLRAP